MTVQFQLIAVSPSLLPIMSSWSEGQRAVFDRLLGELEAKAYERWEDGCGCEHEPISTRADDEDRGPYIDAHLFIDDHIVRLCLYAVCLGDGDDWGPDDDGGVPQSLDRAELLSESYVMGCGCRAEFVQVFAAPDFRPGGPSWTINQAVPEVTFSGMQEARRGLAADAAASWGDIRQIYASTYNAEDQLGAKLREQFTPKPPPCGLDRIMTGHRVDGRTGIAPTTGRTATIDRAMASSLPARTIVRVLPSGISLHSSGDIGHALRASRLSATGDIQAWGLAGVPRPSDPFARLPLS